MMTRMQTRKIEVKAKPEALFAALHTPSAIRQWWGASSAIIIAREGGIWSATWGAEDDPDYISSFRITAFEPPRRILLTNSTYYAKSANLPVGANMSIEFTIEPQAQGCSLQVVHDGFPTDSATDEFYADCETGWRDTFAGITRFVESPTTSSPAADESEPPNPRVTGIGGIFFKAQDAVTLREWYKTHLGVKVEDYGGAMFEWREALNPERKGSTSWSIFKNDTRYLDPSDKPFMINYRVNNLDEVLAYLRNQNITVDDRVEDSEFGRFGWAMDIEGNRLELWQPPEGL